MKNGAIKNVYVKDRLRFIVFCAVLFVLLCSSAIAEGLTTAAREQIAEDSDWRFTRGDPPGAESTTFNDRAWQTINVPHDWSIEGTPDPKSLTGSGGGYFQPASDGIAKRSMRLKVGVRSASVSSLTACI